MSKGVKKLWSNRWHKPSRHTWYLVSCFQCQKFASAVANFCWNLKANSTGMHWLSWKKTMPPKEGGVGFKSFEEFNKVLLAKQLWRLNQFLDTPVARVLKGIYYWNTHSFQALRPYQPSYGWKSIWAARNLINAGSKHIIATGSNTLVWSDKWIPDNDPKPESSSLADQTYLWKFFSL